MSNLPPRAGATTYEHRRLTSGEERRYLQHLSIRPLPETPDLHLEFRARRLPCLHAIIAQGSPVEVSRSQQQAHIDPKDYYLIGTNIKGAWSLIQGDRTLRINPGEAALWRSNLPYRATLHEPYQHACVLISADDLRAQMQHVDTLVARELRASRWVSVLVQRISTMVCQEDPCLDDPQQATRFAQDLVTMLANGITSLDDEPAVVRGRIGSPQLERAKAFIARNLSEPTLSVAAVAAALEISPTHLQRLFNREGMTVASYFWQMRLDRCAAAFRDPLMRGQSIGSIARRHGFNSLPHFSRSFRSKFGETPKSYRARHLPGSVIPFTEL
jgi:AraC-like DNA-binding protein